MAGFRRSGHMMMEKYPYCTDLHCELNGVHRVAKGVCVCVLASVCSVSVFVSQYNFFNNTEKRYIHRDETLELL